MGVDNQQEPTLWAICSAALPEPHLVPSEFTTSRLFTKVPALHQLETMAAQCLSNQCEVCPDSVAAWVPLSQPSSKDFQRNTRFNPERVVHRAIVTVVPPTSFHLKSVHFNRGSIKNVGVHMVATAPNGSTRERNVVDIL